MHPWIADRTASFDSSGIRKVFDLAAKLKDPINLSIGQPHFDVPAEVQDAAIDAIRGGKNAYSVTQGIGPLREALTAEIAAKYPHEDREVFVSSGTSGGLMLAALSMVNPGDEVIFFGSVFRDVSGARQFVWRCAGSSRLVSQFSTQRRPDCIGSHAANKNDPAE